MQSGLWDHADLMVTPNKLTHRLLDDDGEVYYEGRCDSCDDDNAFGPLDNFGGPNAGCTTIQYWQSGKGGGWKTL